MDCVSKCREQENLENARVYSCIAPWGSHCDSWTIVMWLVPIRMGYLCKMGTELLNIQYQKKVKHLSFLHQLYFDFGHSHLKYIKISLFSPFFMWLLEKFRLLLASTWSKELGEGNGGMRMPQWPGQWWCHSLKKGTSEMLRAGSGVSPAFPCVVFKAPVCHLCVHLNWLSFKSVELW